MALVFSRQSEEISQIESMTVSRVTVQPTHSFNMIKTKLQATGQSAPNSKGILNRLITGKRPLNDD